MKKIIAYVSLILFCVMVPTFLLFAEEGRKVLVQDMDCKQSVRVFVVIDDNDHISNKEPGCRCAIKIFGHWYVAIKPSPKKFCK